MPLTHCWRLTGLIQKHIAGQNQFSIKNLYSPAKLTDAILIFILSLWPKRFEADYDDFVFIDENKIQSLIDETEEFVGTVNTLIKFPS